MKQILACFMLFFSLSVYAATTQNELITVMNGIENTWNRGDLNSFLTSYKNSDNTRYISTTIINGYPNIAKRYVEKYGSQQKMGKLKFDIVEVKELSNQYALVIGKYDLTRTNLPNAHGVFTLLFQKVGREWKIIVDHTS